MNTQQRILDLIDKLVIEGEAVINSKWMEPGYSYGMAPTYVDLALYKTWRARCKLLASLLGRVCKP